MKHKERGKKTTQDDIARLTVLDAAVVLACAFMAVSNARAETLVEPAPIVVAAAAPITESSVSSPVEEQKTEVAEETVEEDAAATAPTYTEEDLYYLTHVLTGECQTAPWEEQIAVGSVVLNRVADPEFPSTIRGVIEDKHYGIQYACFYDGNFKRDATQTNIEVAKYLLENGSQLPANVIYQSQHRQGSGTHVKINKHYFCYK